MNGNFYYTMLLIFCVSNISQKNFTLLSSDESLMVDNKARKDSTCHFTFYKHIDKFLDVDRPAINDYEDRHLIPCCMELIGSGDSLAKEILLDRISIRVAKYKAGDMGYGSIYKIIAKTLGNLVDERSLDLALELFNNDEFRITELGCGHYGNYAFKHVVLKLINKDKAMEYKELANAYSRKAWKK